jgi:hypothetical protein
MTFPFSAKHPYNTLEFLRGGILDRREVLRLLAAGSALPVIPANVLAAFREVHAALPESPALKVFNPHQNATVTTMTELIIPATDTPGAKEVRVNEFIDHIVADWFSDEERTGFLAGLAQVDALTQKTFQKDFVDATAAQQVEILLLLGEEMAAAAAAVANDPRPYRGALPEPEKNFYFGFRQLTLTGYFTSEAGFTQQLHEEIIPGRYDSCVPFPFAKTPKGT